MVTLDSLIQILNISFFSNEIYRFIIFFILIFLSFPISKLINYILNNYIMKWAEKTAFKFDDILFRSLNPSITMFVFAGMFYLGNNFLTLGILTPIFAKIFNFLIIVPIVYFLIKFSTEIIGFYLKGDEMNKKVNEAAIDLLMQIIRITLFFVGFLLILSNLGYDVSALLAGLGVGGLAFALAAQDLLKNFFAGISLIFDKTFNKKERVNFNGYSGIIEELKLRSTKIRTYDGTLITVPNSMLSDNIVENVTKSPKVKVKMTIGLEYSTTTAKLKEAKKIIKDIIDKDKTTDSNSIWIWFDNFGPYSLDLQVIYYGKITQDSWPEKVYFKDRINFAIKEEFEKANISMAFPTQTIEIKK